MTHQHSRITLTGLLTGGAALLVSVAAAAPAHADTGYGESALFEGPSQEAGLGGETTATVAPGAAPAAQPGEIKPADPVVMKAARKPAPNSIFLEGLGPAFAYSLNYERRVIDDLGVRVGFSYLSVGASASAGGSTASAKATWLSFPITASYLGLRSGKHGLEVGGGATFTYTSGSAESFGASASGSGITPTANAMVGYRLHPLGEGAGFQFRVGLMAIVGKGLDLSSPNPSEVGVLPWGYISFGASF